MRRWVALLALALAACSDSSGPGEKLVVEGGYTLQSINGHLLPVVLVDVGGAYRLEQVGGKLLLNANRTFVERDSLRETFNDVTGPIQSDTTIVLNGSWELQDSAIVLTTARDGSVLFGVARNDRLILNFESVIADSLFQFVYLKD